MTVDPNAAPSAEPEVVPSSTPSGPQVIPTHGTPPGEPGPDPDDSPRGPTEEFEPTDSDPQGNGVHGLTGGMGVSSERTGPGGPGGDPGSIQGTGTVGRSVTGTHGVADVSPGQWDAVDVSRGDLGPEADEAVGRDTDSSTGVDRTVGEPMPSSRLATS